MISLFLADAEAFFRPSGRRATRFRAHLWCLLEPGLLFAWLMRLQQAVEGRSFIVARIVHVLNLRLTGGEVGVGCEVGGGLVVRHPIGVVVGGGTRIGAAATLLSGVVLGERRPGAPGQAYPSLGDGVVVGTGAAVLGDVRVGDGAVIGAKSLVLHDVPAGATVVGSPARPGGDAEERGER